MTISLGSKFTSKNLDKIVRTYWEKSVNASEQELVTFDLSDLSWIALEELTFLFGWIRYLIINKKQVYVNLPKLDKRNIRTFRRAISLWHRWKIYGLIPFNQQLGRLEYEKYFNVTTQINTLIEEEFEKDRKRQLYNDNNWHKIIPFRFINANYPDDFRNLRDTLKTELDDVFKIEKQIE